MSNLAGAEDAAQLPTWTMLGLALIIIGGLIVGLVFKRWSQPAVICEILAGLALGPSLLGLLPGHLPTVLFPLEVRPTLVAIAQVGIVLFMFSVGLQMDLDVVRRGARGTYLLVVSSIVLPLLAGTGVALLYLATSHGDVGSDAAPWVFVSFIAIAFIVTAFPVLARMLSELGIHTSPLGIRTLAAAAATDMTAWLLLSVLVAFTSRTTSPVATISSLLAVVVAGRFVVGPLLRRTIARWPREDAPFWLAGLLIALALGASAGVSLAGAPAIFGSLLFGLSLPRDVIRRAGAGMVSRIEVPALTLVPVYFVAMGLQIDIGMIGLRGAFELAVVIVASVGSKALAAYASVRWAGGDRRTGWGLATLMNARGLTEIVIIQTGAGMGILNPSQTTVLIMLALITTVLTVPVFRRIRPVIPPARGDAKPAELAPSAAA